MDAEIKNEPAVKQASVEETAKKKLKSSRKERFERFLRTQWIWWLMLLPGIVLTVIFKYGSMFGIIMAFQDFDIFKGTFLGQEWASSHGFGNFLYVFQMEKFWNSVWNTLLISGIKIVLGIIVPLLLAILINEIGKKWFSRVVQTTFFLPFFLSWIILGSILTEMFSYSGIVNTLIEKISGNRILFFLDNNWFRTLVILSDVWKGMGYNMVIFLAAIIGVDNSLYEAVEIDGGNRFQQIIHIMLPSIAPVVVLVMTLSIGGLLNGGFDQILVLYNPMVYDGGDIIDTFVYRLGMFGDRQVDVASAVNLAKSFVTIILLGSSYFFAYKKFDYKIF